MKILTATIAGVCMLLAVTAANANPECPSLEVVRNLGNKFSYAYDIGNDYWVLFTNDGYKVGNNIWMTTFYTPRLPHGIDKDTAFAMGNKLFDNAQMVMNPAREIHGPMTLCKFNPVNAEYIVLVGSKDNE